MSIKNFTEKEAIKAIQNKRNLTIKMVLASLGASEKSGNNYKLIHKIVNKNHLKTLHWKGRGFRKNILIKPVKFWLKNPCPTKISTYSLRNKLFLFKLKDKRCEICGLKKWNKKNIPLELHHKNGIKMDNRLKNLKILCANCHAQTNNYKSKNRK
jgi:hypothetical protein